MRRALKDPSAKIFQPHLTHSPPTLQLGKVNRVITYRGCFNPPHQGHKDALCHAFFRAGADLNIIAAIIIPLDDRHVSRKPQMEKAGAFTLTKDQRIELWNTGGLVGGWHWCYPLTWTSAGGGIEAFKEELLKEVRKDGFELEFLTLLGPDHAGNGRASRKTITCGAKERATFIQDGGLTWATLPQYGDWQAMNTDAAALRRLATEGSTLWLEDKLRMLYPEKLGDLSDDPTLRRTQIERRLRTYTRHLGAVRVCQRLDTTREAWIRFVPTRFIGSQGGAAFIGKQEMALSSTLIRDIIWQCRSPRDLVAQIEGLALNSSLLSEFIRELDWDHPYFPKNNKKKRDPSPASPVPEAPISKRQKISEKEMEVEQSPNLVPTNIRSVWGMQRVGEWIGHLLD
ncbi:hypothetical protein BDV96DRAFT_642951 [Lophiotrema nucula]|uniref:Cytidyltransferase-like domain-containing protein n=1 Tax=Lophiotrema nucula TaxID=690887 RepID=A0A6A5ZHX9_9PLEO|nr:hypothetical protein BDV96DRAFT_642951 [Lophiotrema nucula]